MRTYITLLTIGVFLAGCGEKLITTQPQLTTLTLSVYASAEVQPKNYYLVYPSTPGILQEWFVEVGDTVQKGQLIAQVKNDNSQLQLESAQLTTELATEQYKGQANMLKTIKTEILATQKQLKSDSSNYARQSNLWAKKIGSQTDFEAAGLRYDLSKNRLINLRQRLSQTQMELKNAYLQSQKSLKVAMTQLGDYGIKSIIAGKVFDIKSKSGELVSLQQPIAAIGSANDFLVELWVDEVDISKVRIGQTIFIALDAYPAQSFEGEIVKMYPEKNDKNQSFKVEAIFKKKPARIFAGLSGEANIVLGKKRNTLIIPQQYLLNDSTVLTKGGEVKITTGEQNMSHIEVLSGIDSSTVIIAPSVK